MTDPVRVGVVGAGPWAKLVHAPMWARCDETELAGVWARRSEAAEEVAGANGSRAFGSFDELLGNCDAVSFAVPPDVQATYAASAARAGKAIALDKPIALTVADAERLAAAVANAGVGSQVLFTWRYAGAVRAWLEAVAAAEPIGARGVFVSGAFLGGMFATPWRLEHGALFDLGPHVIDLLDAALGRVVGVRAVGDSTRFVSVLLEHESGAVSEAGMTGRSALRPSLAGVDVYTESEVLSIDTESTVGPEAIAQYATEFARTARGEAHSLDVRRGLRVQRVIEHAARQLTS